MKKKINPSLLMSLCILLTILIVFGTLTDGKIFHEYNLLVMINQSMTTIIAGLGMIFVVSMGGTDITTGVAMALAGTLAAMAAQISFALVFPAAIAVGIVMGGVMGIVNAKFKVPSFMASLAILIAGRAYINLLLSNRVVYATAQFLALDEYRYKLPLLVLFILVIGYIFKYTPFGYYVKAIGENEVAVQHMGINIIKVKIIAFIISAIMASLAGLFAIARTGGASNTMGTGMEMSVMMALFIGGVPVSGGLESKIYKLLIGAPMITLLQNGLVLSGTSGAFTQGVQGVALLLVVYLTLFLNKKANTSFEIIPKKRKLQSNTDKAI